VSRCERGETLIEVVVTTGVVAVTLVALISATLAATHRFGPDPIQTALQMTLQNEMRVAADVLKYQGGSVSAQSVATAIPMPSGSPLPAHISIGVSPLPGGGIALTLHAASDADSNEATTLNATLPAPVPLPGSTITAPSTAPAPN
jgi:hypothetical protein